MAITIAAVLLATSLTVAGVGTAAHAVTPARADAATLLAADFEQGSLAATGWTSSLGPAQVVANPDATPDNQYVTKLGYTGTFGQNLLAPAVSTVGYEAITVNYRVKTVGAVGTAKFTLNYFDPASNLVTIASTQVSGSTSGWIAKTAVLPASAENGSSITLVFTTTSAAAGTAYVDDVVISGTPTAIFAAGFEQGALTTAGWTSPSAEGIVAARPKSTVANAYALDLPYAPTSGADAVSPSVDLTGLGAIRVSFSVNTQNTAAAAKLSIGYRYGPSGTLETLPITIDGDTSGWQTETLNLGADAWDQQIQLVFQTTGSGTGDAFIDDVRLLTEPSQAGVPVIDSAATTLYSTPFESATQFSTDWTPTGDAVLQQLYSRSQYGAVRLGYGGSGGYITSVGLDTTSYTGSDPIYVMYSVRTDGTVPSDQFYAEVKYNQPGSAPLTNIGAIAGATGGWVTEVAQLSSSARNDPNLVLQFRTAPRSGATADAYVDDVVLFAGSWHKELQHVPNAINPYLVTGPQLPSGVPDSSMPGGLPAGTFLGAKIDTIDYAVAADASYVYWGDYGTGKINRIPRGADGRISLSSAATTIATASGHVFSLVVGSDGSVFYSTDSESATGTVVWIKPNGTTQTIASGLTRPRQITLDSAGNLYVATELDGFVRRWNRASNTVDIVATGLLTPQGLAVTSDGHLYVQEYGRTTNELNAVGAGFAGGSLKRVTLSTGQIETVVACDAERFWRARGLALQPDGSLLISNEANAWDQGNSSAVTELGTDGSLNVTTAGMDYSTFIASGGQDQFFSDLAHDGYLVGFDTNAVFALQDWSSVGPTGLAVETNGGTWTPSASGDLTVDVNDGTNTVELKGDVTPDPGSDQVTGWVSVPVTALPAMNLSPIGGRTSDTFALPDVTTTTSSGTVVKAVIPLRSHDRSRWPEADAATPALDFNETPAAYLVYIEWHAP